jgi:hypothetical protein
MSRIIERALSIINDNLKDQTTSFADPVSIKPMARGGDVKGRILQDEYPTHYLPHIGRQVMADGGAPVKGFEGRVFSPPPVEEPVSAEGVEAYHGSPHEFENFDISKIGTGEGAQVYGHGLYFAGNENVAKYYRDSLTDPDNVPLHFKGKPVDTVWNDEISDRWKDIVKKLPKDHEDDFQTVMGNLSQINNMSDLKHIRANLDRKQNNILDKIVLPELSKPEIGSGHMYEVRIDAHPEEHLLDWDKPLKDQHPNVLAAFNKSVIPIKDDEDKMIHEMYGNKAAHEYLGLFDRSKGSQAYKTFAEHLGGPEKASAALAEAGIRGIRYLDAGSRGQDEQSGSHNYVIFDPKHIKIKRRYAEGGEIPEKDDEGIAAYAFGNSIPHLDQRIKNEYQGSHQSPGPENGAPLWRMHDLYPDDLYSSNGFRYYADYGLPYDREGYNRAISYVNRPNSFVTIYRAVPKDTSIKNINPSDWVTLTRSYAKDHGESTLGGEYKILKKMVRARDLFTHADSIHEFGYNPQPRVSDDEIVSRMSDEEAKNKLERLSPQARTTLKRALENRLAPKKAYGGDVEDNDIQLSPDAEAIDEMPDQAFNSAKTSRNQIPALFNSPAFERNKGSRNLDYGGGAFDKGSEYLAQEHGVDSQVYDPFNRSKEHNDFVLKGFKKEPADTATVANVLNVIAEPEARMHVIKQVHQHIKPDGKAYFTVYEGDGKDKNSGNSRMTRDGWQENRPTHSYVEEIKQVFPDVRLSGKTIIASKKPAKAYGGSIPGPKLTEENADDFARRLIAWTFATAPLFHRATGGSVIDDPLDVLSKLRR